MLVKNVNSTLPLNSPAFLSLYGYDAYAPLQNDPTYGSRWNSGYESLNVSEAVAGSLLGSTNSFGKQQAAYNGTIISGGGSGSVSPPYIACRRCIPTAKL